MRKFLSFLLLLLIAAKIAAVLVRGPVSIEMDARGYWDMSTAVMEGDLFLMSKPVAFRTPVYPWFLAAIRLVSGPHALMTIVVVQGLLNIASIFLAGHIAARVTKFPRAMTLTLLCSLPAVSAITFSAAVLTESLFVFLLMLNLLAVIDYAKYCTGGRASWLGFTFAVTLLTRPIVMLLWVPHLLFLFWIGIRRRSRLGDRMPRRFRFRSRMKNLALAALTVMVVVSPWLMRNQLLFGKPFLTEFVGRNIWIVTFQDGSGAGLDLPETKSAEHLKRRLANVGVAGEESWRHTWTVSNGLVASGLSDPQADQLMKRVSLEAVPQNQELAGYKALRRVCNFWRCAATDLPAQSVEHHAMGPQTMRPQTLGQQIWLRVAPPIDTAIEYRWSQSVMLNTVLLFAMGLAALILLINKPTRPYGFWIIGILAYFAVVTGVLEIPDYRYRMVLEPIVAMTFGAALAVLISRKRKPAKVTTA